MNESGSGAAGVASVESGVQTTQLTFPLGTHISASMELILRSAWSNDIFLGPQAPFVGSVASPVLLS